MQDLDELYQSVVERKENPKPGQDFEKSRRRVD